MNVNGDVQCFGGGEDVPEFFVVQVFALRVGVDDGSFEAQFVHAALEFLCGCGGVLRGDGGQAGEACGVAGDGFGELVVEGFSEADRRVGVEDLDAVGS
jgi:hypothetical protein